MKETILTCDRCKSSTLAITTLTLSNGISKPTSLDLCRRHKREVLVTFTSLRRQKASPITKEQFQTLKTTTLSYLTKPTAPLAISTSLGIPGWRTSEVLAALLKEKKITKTGRNRGARYTRSK